MKYWNEEKYITQCFVIRFLVHSVVTGWFSQLVGIHCHVQPVDWMKSACLTVITRRRWKDNMEISIVWTGCGYVDWIRLDQGKVEWPAFVGAVMNLLFIGHVNYGIHYHTSRTSNTYDPNRSWLWTRVASIYGTARVSRYEFCPCGGSWFFQHRVAVCNRCVLLRFHFSCRCSI